jgi:N4-gp56 family major capsid protein
MANVNTTTIDPGNTYFYVKNMLKRSLPYLVHDRFGKVVPYKRSNGKTIKFRRYNSLALANTPVVEGVLPAEASLSKTDIVATLKQYINWLEETDVADVTNIESVKTEMSDTLGENMGQTMDVVYRDSLGATTSIYRANAHSGTVVADTDINSVMAEDDLQRIDRLLVNNKAMYYAPMTKGSGSYATSPIRPAYYGIMDVDCKVDAEALTGWTSVEKYAGQTQTEPSEIGSYGNFRFVISQQALVEIDSGAAVGSGYISTSGVLNDLYNTLIFGQDAYCICPLEGMNVQNIFKDFGSAGTNDPANQLMTMAWKAMTTLALTQELNMCNYKVCATE